MFSYKKNQRILVSMETVSKKKVTFVREMIIQKSSHFYIKNQCILVSTETVML